MDVEGLGRSYGMWLYKVIDEEVRMHVLEDLEKDIKEVEGCLQSRHHDLKEYVFSGAEVRHLLSCASGNMKLYELNGVC